MKISTKVLGSVLLIFVVAFAGLAYVVDDSARSAVVEQAGQRLALVKRARVEALETYFTSLSNTLTSISRALTVETLLRQMPAVVRQLPPDQTRHQQASLDAYSRLRDGYQSIISRYARDYAISDIVLATPDGAVIYCMSGSMQPGTNLRSGSWPGTPLGQAFERARQPGTREVPAFTDFVQAPGTIAPASFAAVPAFGRSDGAFLGVLIASIPLAVIDHVIAERVGFGATQETYVVGPDRQIRSQSRPLQAPDNHSAITTDAVRRAFAGESGVIEERDHRNRKVLSSFAPLRIAGTRWALLTEMDLDEVLIPARALHNRLLLMLAALIITGSVLLIAVLRVVILSPISRLTDAARRIEAGRFDQPVPVTSADELGQLGRLVNTMMASIQASLQHTRAKLAESQVDLREVAARLNSAREQERALMAGDIHDHLGQALTVFKMDVTEVRRRIAAGNHPGADERLREMLSHVDDAIDDTRRLASELRPTAFDDVGPVEAMRGLLLDYSQRTGLECEFDATVDAAQLNTDLALALFRILQEALTNVLRHARAHRVDVRLAVAPGEVSLTVQDDGVGIPAPAERHGFGLVGMRDRALLFGGDLLVSSGDDGGTTIEARLPLEQPA